MKLSRRGLIRGLGGAVFGAPLLAKLFEREARAAAGRASRAIFFYFPDGVAGPSQNGQPTLWHAMGSETSFVLSDQLRALERHKSECLFFNGLSMGPTDSGSHPGGAKKLLTAADGGNNESIDQFLARTAGAAAPWRHLYLGVMANADNASGDKHLSYPSAGQSIAPEDNPLRAFERLFANTAPSMPAATNPQATVIDAIIDDLDTLRMRLGNVEKRKLDLHMEALREVEGRIKSMPPAEQAVCDPHAPPGSSPSQVDLFPELLRQQIDLTVEAMACGLTQVAVIQASHHTSELIMSRFPNTEMYDPGFDMRSHQASHYGASHDLGHREFRDYVAQRRWWVEQFAYLLDRLRSKPEGTGTMLDHSLVFMGSEVCDGNTHLHDNMPFVLAGRSGGAINPGRLLQFDYRRHGDLFVAMAQAMGQSINSFGDASSGPLPGVLA